MSENILNKICLQTLCDLEIRKRKTPLEQLKENIGSAENPRGFFNSIKQKIETRQTALICEVKKASPSKGLIREDFRPSEIAKAYEEGGATCLSVLTDEPFFQGHMDYLTEAKNACNLPILRKDFMLDEYQVYEARAIGADCILLIVAALEDTKMRALLDLAHDLGMDVLIEVHDEDELFRAQKLKPELLGVNNRNLKTLEVDLNTSHKLIKSMDDNDSVPVSESGVYTKEDIAILQESGFYCFLVGESLMRQKNITLATKNLLS